MLNQSMYGCMIWRIEARDIYTRYLYIYTIDYYMSILVGYHFFIFFRRFELGWSFESFKAFHPAREVGGQQDSHGATTWCNSWVGRRTWTSELFHCPMLQGFPCIAPCCTKSWNHFGATFDILWSFERYQWLVNIPKPMEPPWQPTPGVAWEELRMFESCCWHAFAPRRGLLQGTIETANPRDSWMIKPTRSIYI